MEFQKRRKNRFRKGIAGLFVLGAVYAALMPAILNTIANVKQQSVICSFEEEQSEKDDEEIEEQLRAARAYNEELYEYYRKHIFLYASDGESDERYNQLLGEEGEAFAWIRIEKINVQLPILHGTSGENLSNAAGHMYGSSLPIGGDNTHAVIAAHTGLSSARLFSDLNQLEIGDSFSISVLNEELIYEVEEVLVVLPEEEYHYLQIEEGADLVTLYTCTPIGINDHRLLVRGRHKETLRTKKEAGKEQAEEEKLVISQIQITIVIKLLIFIGIPLFFWILYIINLCYTPMWISLLRRNSKDAEREKDNTYFQKGNIE